MIEFMNQKFYKFTDKMPPVNIKLELREFSGKIKNDLLVKVEYINNEVVYTWENSQNKVFESWRFAH